jgi:hypothetical protein
MYVCMYVCMCVLCVCLCVYKGCEAFVREEGDLEIVVGEVGKKRITTQLDPIYLSIFSHRCVSVCTPCVCVFMNAWHGLGHEPNRHFVATVATAADAHHLFIVRVHPSACAGSWASRSRWVGPCSARPSASTSRSGSTSAVLSSMEAGASWPMRRTCLCTWGPCRRPLDTR